MLCDFKYDSLYAASILEPPSDDSIAASVKSLQDVGAFDDEQNLTALGQILAQFPVDVRIGKLMVYGAIFQVYN